MSKTPFSKKCEILGEVYALYKNSSALDEGWKTFFRNNDVGLPLAYCLSNGIATIVEGNEEYVDQTFLRMCINIGLSPEDEYNDLQSMFALSIAERKLREDELDD
jgi:hypothetical protein